MSNDQDPEATIRALEEQLEAARAKAKIEAMEAELAALKAKDAGVAEAEAAAKAAAEAEAAEAAAAAKAAEEAARVRAAEEAAAAKEAAESQAAADRAAGLEAELAALKAKQAEADRLARLEAETAALRAQQAAAASAAAVAAAPAVASAPVASAPAAAQPEVRYVETAPPKKRGGLVAALVVMSLALVASLGATYFAIRGDLRGPWAAPAPVPTDVVLIGAGDAGPAPAKTEDAPIITFDTLSQPATGTAPEALASLTVSQVAGDTPEIYGLSYAGCQGIDAAAEENAPIVAAYMAALNTDETLGLGRALTPADYDAFRQNLAFGHLLADTRVTYNGYSAGATFPIQAVLQKGTLVGYDRFGVPRLHCGSLVALTAPVAGGGETRFSGGAWGDLDLTALVTIAPATAAQSTFTVLPVGPANVQTAFPVSSTACARSAPGACPDPSALTLVPAIEKSASAPVPTPTECSNWPAGASDADMTYSRIVNASGSTLQWFMAQSVDNGCGARLDGAMGDGASSYMGYWSGTLVLFTDGQSATPLTQYVFGEQTLFVIQ